MDFLLLIVGRLVQGIAFVLFLDAILSWFQEPDQFPRRYTRALADPIYAPLRGFLIIGGMDLSPLVMILGLNFLANVLLGAVSP
ncbi:MAG: YggT family protein [Myxococcota bacterium]|nr:YggT family protein [Myxococcota bacterium]